MIRRKIQQNKARKKPIALVLALMLMSGGVALALLQSQNTMTGNTISSESANMMISQADSNYSTTIPGYSFNGIIPGQAPSPTKTLFLKNTGTANMALKMSLTSTPTNTGGVDLSKVHILLIPFDTVTYMPHTSSPQDFSLQQLVDAGSGGIALSYPTTLMNNTKEEFYIQASMDDGAAGNAGATIGNINLAFTGTATN